jgi:lysophospholipase L1-like esterase
MRTFVAECRARGVVPVFETGIYSSANTGYEAARAAVNSAVIAYGAANNIPVIDVGGLITAGNAATYLADGVHPNDAGQLLMMPEYKRVIYQESARAVVA